MGIPEDSDIEQIRNAYINLAKKYHPDVKSEEADSMKFQEVITLTYFIKIALIFYKVFRKS